MRSIRKFRATLGPLEQAQIVASTAVVVAMVTIVAVRIFSRYQLGWFDFTSVIIVGIFGFLIVYFTLTYGRQLEEQKQELLALKTIAEAVNRNVGTGFLLQNAVNEVRRILDAEYIAIHLVERGRLLLKAEHGAGTLNVHVLPPDIAVDDPSIPWIHAPQLVHRPSRIRRSAQPWKLDPLRVYVSVPISTKESFAGVFIVASRDASAVGSKVLELLSGFANQIGVALENAQLFELVRRSEERYMDLFERAPDMYHLVNREGIIVSCNQTEATALGCGKEQLIGHPIFLLYPPNGRASAEDRLTEMFTTGREMKEIEEEFVTSAGVILQISSNTSIILDEAGKPEFIRFASRDITEKKKLEAKVLHAQRIDSIGSLAGGVSHDFNNILTSILGSTSILKRKLRAANPNLRLVEVIETAAKRGAGLTRQLLTFARRGTISHRPVSIHNIIAETLDLFERGSDKSIHIEQSLKAPGAMISGDEGQIQQALLNLLLNARDAMQSGGSVTVACSLADSTYDESGRPVSGGEGKRFVQVSITDTGVGIEPAIQPRIFEPFFTTKEQGRGTGLGLSVVYGVVNSHGGHITFTSAPGRGSEFTLYFPLSHIEKPTGESVSRAKLPTGTETILVVDDQQDVREIVGNMLDTLGYTVAYAQGGKEAISLLKKRKGRPHLIILDLDMPQMSGKEALMLIKKSYSTLPVLVSSGYGETSIESPHLRELTAGFLQKPYQIEELAHMVREVLG